MPFPDTERLAWFETHARRVITSCRKRVDAVPGLTSEPMTVYVPGGDDKYPSFWLRDAAMQARSGLIPAEEMDGMLRIMLHFQHGAEERTLANGLRIPPWSIADHINLPGLGTPESQPVGPVFFPGTYQSGDNQGDGSFGTRPADDSAYEVIELAHLLVQHLGFQRGRQLLCETVNELPIIERLHKAWQSVPVDLDTHLPLNTEDDWSANSFTDALRVMGLVSLPGVFRIRAARRMSLLCEVAGRAADGELYLRQAAQLSDSLAEHCQLDSGWLMFGTELNRLPDTWSTLQAVYEGVLPAAAHEDACDALLSAYHDGTAVDRESGYIRHTLTTADVEPGRRIYEHQADDERVEEYQYGGYWPQCVGCYCWAIRQLEPVAARRLAATFIDHTRAHADEGAPVEWLYPGRGLPEMGRWYGPSAALPLETFRRLG